MRDRRTEMPAQFTLTTVIEEGWRCSPQLGKFLREQVGREFRFNAAVREFVHTQTGKPVSAIIERYRASVAPGVPRPPLPPQLEYNRHMQEYSLKHPGASRSGILEA